MPTHTNRVYRNGASSSSDGQTLLLHPAVSITKPAWQYPHTGPVLFCKQVLLGPHPVYVVYINMITVYLCVYTNDVHIRIMFETRPHLQLGNATLWPVRSRSHFHYCHQPNLNHRLLSTFQKTPLLVEHQTVDCSESVERKRARRLLPAAAQ